MSLTLITQPTIDLENFRNLKKRRCIIVNVRRKPIIEGKAA